MERCTWLVVLYQLFQVIKSMLSHNIFQPLINNIRIDLDLFLIDIQIGYRRAQKNRRDNSSFRLRAFQVSYPEIYFCWLFHELAIQNRFNLLKISLHN